MDQKTIQTDLLVAGGGMAGVCAAIAAARHGAKVVLVQDRSVLGGNASSEVRMHIVGADCHGSRKGTRESGIMEELRLEDAVRNPTRCHPLWDIILYEKVIAEPNITLLLDTALVSVEMAGTGSTSADLPQRPARTDRMYEFIGKPGRIQSARAVRQITQDEFAIQAKFFADCTGDGRLGFEAGADFRIGRESKAMHGESLAQEVDDIHTLGSSILLTSRRTEARVPFVAPPWARKFNPEMLKVGRGIGSWEYGFWWVEWGGQIDSIKDQCTTIRHELYAIALGIWDYIKNSGRYPGSENWTLDWVGALPGKRESRRFLGRHILTQQDVQEAHVFEDEVAYGGWGIDLHPPKGVDDIANPPFVSTPVKKPYGIPLRSYLSRNIENLFFAGRNISTTHVAFGSTRVMATCAIGGEAVGIAAAYCLQQRITPAELCTQQKHIHELKQLLLRDDAMLLNTLPDPSLNKAHVAKITASSSMPGFSPENLMDGFTRDELNPKTGQIKVAHAWRSQPLQEQSPAWIEFEWRESTPIHEIHLWFDTGFARQLTLSQSESTSRSTVRGPQPETVRDYSIELDGKPIITEPNNYQRKRVHVLPASVEIHRLRITLRATHGVPEARLFDVRVY
ncbi:MAG TPA: FAD-dependent oxidoreductase [Tepidisphaeraceae bacterium]|nr:FAD-dependent oxidoreductase [Tepidisphaeraceae bacterium]